MSVQELPLQCSSRARGGCAGKEPPPTDVPAPEPIPFEESDAIMADLCVLALAHVCCVWGCKHYQAQVVIHGLHVFLP